MGTVMTEGLTADELREIFGGPFRAYCKEAWVVEWRTDYVRAVERVRGAGRIAWIEPAFQKMLWDENPVSNIGPGNAGFSKSAQNSARRQI